jgi:hypothetical protein
VGLGFLTASAFLAMKTALGATTVALLTGLGLSVLAAGMVVLTRRQQPPAPRPAEAAWSPPAALGPYPPDAASLFAFTVAFLLARYLARRLRG